jgi:uncharacterized OB-fold protein
MSLEKCPECGHDISTQAVQCPYCGAPGQSAWKQSKLVGLCVSMVMLFIILFAALFLSFFRR